MSALPTPEEVAAGLCEDCPPVGYPTDKTRCLPCPRRAPPPEATELTGLCERLRELLAKATPGPWEADSNAYGCNFVYGCDRQALVCGGNNHDTLTIEDAALIAAMKNALPTLLSEIALGRERMERLRHILARYGDRVPMAMCHRADWQQEIDDALSLAADNPANNKGPSA